MDVNITFEDYNHFPFETGANDILEHISTKFADSLVPITSIDDRFHPLLFSTVYPGNDASAWYTSKYKTGILISFAVIVSLVTILANLTIIILASSDRKLRKMNSYLIINLACMDLIVGLFVIPCMSAYNILGYWPLGNFICDLWTCVDFMCCTASFFNLCVISWDRFGAITNPLQHRCQRRSKPQIFWLILLPWLASGLSWVPAIVAWRVVLGYAGDGECIYLTGKYYVLITNIIVYCIPMLAIIYLYGRVWYAVRSQMRDLLEKPTVGNSSKNETLKDIEYALDNMGFQDDGDKTHSQTHSVKSVDSSLSARNPQVTGRKQITRETSSDMSSASSRDSSTTIGKITNGRTTGKDMERERLKKFHMARMMTHKRTTKTLGIIVTVFLICWMPWAVLYPLNGFCRCVPNWMYIACYWAAYLNSTFNPFLYGFNRDFRKAFKKIILYRCRCRQN
ncbi:probable G-protein coupled receptor No18 [Amphiura filiformis]|uniref:probable G-protein coupled receptor No18 n=1 Tax=Amphiura filiformis TaxID=82378 RepID=UPI003B219723